MNSMAPPTSGARGGTVYAWEDHFQRDPRRERVKAALDRILITNFPAIAERLQRAEPPAQRYAPAPTPTEAPVNAQDTDGQHNGQHDEGAAASSRNTESSTTREFLDISAYMTESSNEMDSQSEIDPVEELRAMEKHDQERARIRRQDMPDGNGNDDVEMEDPMDTDAQPLHERRRRPEDRTASAGSGSKQRDAGAKSTANVGGGEEDNSDKDEDDEDDDEEQTACAVCQTSKDEKNILLCDSCDDEYHIYCLTPPLREIPSEEWFCPKCVSRGSTAPNTAVTDGEVVMEDATPVENNNSGNNTPVKPEERRPVAEGMSQAVASDPPATAAPSQESQAATSISIAQSFEANPQTSNRLLVHACNCDAVRCSDALFQEYCPHMKRFLRSACWASHNEKWMSYRIAKVTAELFAFHSLHCEVESCNVPMCDELRGEEYV